MFKKKMGVVRFKDGRTEKVISTDIYWDRLMSVYVFVETKTGKYLCVESHEYKFIPFPDDNPTIPLKCVNRYFKLNSDTGCWVATNTIKDIELVPRWKVSKSKSNKPFVKIKVKKSKKKGAVDGKGNN